MNEAQETQAAIDAGHALTGAKFSRYSERMLIVKWLRGFDSVPAMGSTLVHDLADLIERGEHVK